MEKVLIMYKDERQMGENKEPDLRKKEYTRRTTVEKMRKKRKCQKVLPRFELGSWDSESQVLTITP